mmetsp:Transcript_11006/g.21264  ORF Transcript_11006/g.21264 Transcript_11006/m.21264 type:complete len:107 (-) Transcript_11006:71-391(-)
MLCGNDLGEVVYILSKKVLKFLERPLHAYSKGRARTEMVFFSLKRPGRKLLTERLQREVERKRGESTQKNTGDRDGARKYSLHFGVLLQTLEITLTSDERWTALFK